MLPSPLTTTSVIMPKPDARYPATYPPTSVPTVMQSLVTRPALDGAAGKAKGNLVGRGLGPAYPLCKDDRACERSERPATPPDGGLAPCGRMRAAACPGVGPLGGRKPDNGGERADEQRLHPGEAGRRNVSDRNLHIRERRTPARPRARRHDRQADLRGRGEGHRGSAGEAQIRSRRPTTTRPRRTS